ncbi:hypothetical protein [Ferruginibacter sp.]
MQYRERSIKNELPAVMMTNSYTSGYDQHRQEYLSWSRLLETLGQESAFLKTRLSEAVDRGIDKEALALAEHFQNQFIIKDDCINELKQDIQIANNNMPVIMQEAKQNKLRNEIRYFEKSFYELKNEFDKFLLSVSGA